MDSFLLTKSLAILAAVLGLMYLGFIIMRKRAFFKNGGGEERIKIKTYCRIDQKTSLALIEVDGRSFLLASNGVALALEKMPQKGE